MKNYLSALTIFIGSFLVFGVQPMIGRTLLPVFGGTASVWVVCLCAFQVLLLAGYFYAHVLAGRHSGSAYLTRCIMLVAAAALTAFVGLKRNAFANMVATGVPSVDVLLCVCGLVGFAYVLLSANASLVQTLSGGRGVYRLYAVSNFGSLLGLLAYPFVLEPSVSLTAQWIGFAAGIAVYAVLLLALVRGRRIENGESRIENGAEDSATGKAPAVPPHVAAALWLLIPAVSCFFLNALTTHVTLDVMPMPLIWTGSLSLFLLSYIVGFSGKSERLVTPFAFAALALVAAVGWTNGKAMGRQISFPAALSLYGALLFVVCAFLHSWLYALRPDRAELTKYYFLQALGGALGGSVASLAFPNLAKTVMEYPVSLVLAGAAGCAYFALARARAKSAAAVIVGVAAVVMWFMGAKVETRPVVFRGRGFFGTVEVLEAKARTAKGEGRIHEFVHGTTIHGIQALLPGKERMPTTYYTPNASGYAIVAHPKYRAGLPMRVNITGLGVGVLFCYGRTNDYYRAYEISKDALDVASNTNLFTFVSSCPAKKDIILGDARKGLEAELAAGAEPYDVIVVDAFTGDNLPYHLSTKEAFDLYFKLLKPDGVLCVNISNWHLALEPFMKTVGETYDVPLLGLATSDNFATLAFGAKIACFCRSPEGLANPPFNVQGPHGARMIDFSRCKRLPSLPTDEKGSFINLINW